MKYYVDTCIYINLWKIEERAGRQFWRIAKEFLDSIPHEDILYSGFILKELRHRTDAENFRRAQEFLFACTRITATDQDYQAARALEMQIRFRISFFDCMHVVLAHRNDAILVTRDRLLLKFAKSLCQTARPEDLK